MSMCIYSGAVKLRKLHRALAAFDELSGSAGRPLDKTKVLDAIVSLVTVDVLNKFLAWIYFIKEFPSKTMRIDAVLTAYSYFVIASSG